MSQVEFQQALSSARVALDQNPSGELALPLRRRIWDAMGTYGRDPGAPSGSGYRGRSRLDLLAAERALALWPLDQADAGAARRVLELAEGWVEKRGDADLLRRQQQRLLTRGDDLLAEGQYAAGYVAHACAAVASTVLVDHDLTVLPSELLDDELDPDTWDASYYAALVATSNKNTPEERRAFWSWYLKAAERAYDARTPRQQTTIRSDGSNASPEQDAERPLASEEDIKQRVLAPWLSQLGLDASDVRYETQLRVAIGKQFDITIGEPRQQDKRAYPDIVCYRGEHPVFVVEVKRDDEPLGEKARQVAISYARLLPEFAPFAVVANSTVAHLYDVISGAEIQSVAESEHYRKSGVISLLPETRAEAKLVLIELLLAA